LHPDLAIQGNLDPVALLAPWPALKQRARDVLDRAAGRRGHVFNLGHGILPRTPVDNVRRLVDFVHTYRPVSVADERQATP
jgi:uroporphyrinogen decarboxylase